MIPQPDALLRIESAQGGQSRVIDTGYVEGSPELIVEIAGTSADYDLQDKLEVYQRCGVQGIHCVADAGETSRLVSARQ